MLHRRTQYAAQSVPNGTSKKLSILLIKGKTLPVMLASPFEGSLTRYHRHQVRGENGDPAMRNANKLSKARTIIVRG